MASTSSSPHHQTASTIASCLAVPTNGLPSQIAQLEHRLNLNETWEKLGPGKDPFAFAGKVVLELGCGQGDHTVALATAVGDEGRVVGVDPGSPDYEQFENLWKETFGLTKSFQDTCYEISLTNIGSPFTLAQAHSHILNSPLGSRVSFHQATGPDFLLRNPSSRFDAAVLSHCTFYFPSYASIRSTFAALKASKVPRLLLAEWSMSISTPQALPHLLAVLAQSMGPAEGANVQSAVSPVVLTRLAEEAGWRLVEQETLPSPQGMKDGEWEVWAAEAQGGEEKMVGEGGGEESGKAWESHRDALEASLVAVGGKKGVHCMDVWCAVFE